MTSHMSGAGGLRPYFGRCWKEGPGLGHLVPTHMGGT